MKPCNLQNVDGAREYYAKQNNSEKDKHHMISLICGIQEKSQMIKGKKRGRQTKKQTFNYTEQIDGYQKGGGGDG